MGAIRPGMTQEEIDREMVAEHLARKKTREEAGAVLQDYPSVRVRRFLHDLHQRFEAAGRADPEVVEELLNELEREGRR